LEQGTARKLTLPVGGGIDVTLRFLHRRAVTAYFVDCPRLFDREGLYGVDGRPHEDNDVRFATLCSAALEGAKAVGFRPDIIHAHDWQAGPVCSFLKRAYADDAFFASTSSVFTIHNMAYQGNFPRAALERSGFVEADWNAEGVEYYGQVSFLKAGITSADLLTTVSRTYAREICESGERGFGFEGLLRRRAPVLRGILNGIDVDVWDPARDPALAARYSLEDASAGKRTCREALRREGGLDASADRPMLGIVSRLDYMKGLDLAAAAIEPLLDRAQLVVLGTGDRALTELYAGLESRHPGAVRFFRTFDESLAHRIYGACDFFLMPSRFEPCGLGQMLAMRYGAVPVAAQTGGLADTVFEEAAAGRAPNGFLCAPNDGAALGRALQRALAARGGAQWDLRVRSAMSGDFSWDRSAAEYLEFYKEAESS
jgi:starch synthase